MQFSRGVFAVALSMPDDSLESLWTNIFWSSGRIKDGSGNILGIKTVKEYSQFRPRDFIAFLREAAFLGIQGNRVKFSQPLLEAAIPRYSRFALLEVSSEMRMLSVHADIGFNSLRHLNKPRFLTEELRNRLTVDLKKASMSADPEEILTAFIQCGVLGNSTRNMVRFVYQDPLAPFNIARNLELHKSMYHALSIS